MFFSICIPQYNRYEHLKQQLLRLQEQSCQDFEVCISDDISSECRWEEVRAWLQQSGMPHVYKVQEKNLRYDANLRAAIGLASGDYVLLMGNDDRLASRDTLAQLRIRLEKAGLPEVALTNYVELGSGRIFRRVMNDGQVVSGLAAALSGFRNYSFVSGILMQRERAQALATDKWDGSEMYQMALGSRIVASGGRLLAVDLICIEKDIQLPGESVDSYVGNRDADVSWLDWWSGRRAIPLARYSGTAWDAVKPYAPPEQECRVAFNIVKQTLMTTYPFWIFEYKRVFGVKSAVGLALGMRPRFLLVGFPPSWRLHEKVRLLYVAVTLIALAVPVRLFRYLEPKLHRRAKQATWQQ